MYIDGFEIDEASAGRLLRAFGADGDDIADPERRAEAVRLIIAYLATSYDAEPGGINGMGREQVEREPLALAGAAILPEVEVDTRGEPMAVWTPENGWRGLEAAPLRWPALETAIAELREQLLRNPELRLLSSVRLLPTNERAVELVIAKADEDVSVTVSSGEERVRYTIRRDSAVVIGIPAGDAQTVAQR